ncbi:MAG: 16S rRNA (guanine(527)-N(7))-methyltransferase RsmG [Tepidisphaeraceae bacterium]|jgi:16S rRNA (guanine527-N7)-methyltransferase
MHALSSQLAPLSEEQLNSLDRYLDLLLEANAVMNLTRITDRASAEVLHVADALTLVAHLPRESHRLADVGSGGGVPGIPLAIARPDVSIVLIESTRKKAAFLDRAIRELALCNVVVRAERAERLTDCRGKFDVVTARAVAAIGELAQWCFPLLKPGGRLLAMKGAKAAEEIDAAKKVLQRLGAEQPIVHRTELPGAENHVVVELHKKK